MKICAMFRWGIVRNDENTFMTFNILLLQDNCSNVNNLGTKDQPAKVLTEQKGDTAFHLQMKPTPLNDAHRFMPEKLTIQIKH